MRMTTKNDVVELRYDDDDPNTAYPYTVVHGSCNHYLSAKEMMQLGNAIGGFQLQVENELDRIIYEKQRADEEQQRKFHEAAVKAAAKAKVVGRCSYCALEGSADVMVLCADQHPNQNGDPTYGTPHWLHVDHCLFQHRDFYNRGEHNKPYKPTGRTADKR